MKVSLSWLNDYVAVAMGVDALAHQLTMAGLEVEGVEDRYDYLDTVVVGRISAITPHPNADKLRLCQVQIGGAALPVVCGAPNAAEGMLAPLALPGSHLPDGTIVAEGTIRGQRSAGMLCSAGELGLGDDRSGLMALAADLKPGTPLNKALGLSDAVMEISITPNRPDCLSIIGIAREVAGFQADTLRRAAIALPAARGRIDKLTSVIIEAPDHCPRYAARLLDEITVGPSPFWRSCSRWVCGPLTTSWTSPTSSSWKPVSRCTHSILTTWKSSASWCAPHTPASASPPWMARSGS